MLLLSSVVDLDLVGIDGLLEDTHTYYTMWKRRHYIYDIDLVSGKRRQVYEGRGI